MRAAGLEARVVEARNLQPVKTKLAVPVCLQSCHTAEIGGVIEGHVPAAAVKRLLAERPVAVGLAVPGIAAHRHSCITHFRAHRMQSTGMRFLRVTATRRGTREGRRSTLNGNTPKSFCRRLSISKNFQDCVAGAKIVHHVGLMLSRFAVDGLVKLRRNLVPSGL